MCLEGAEGAPRPKGLSNAKSGQGRDGSVSEPGGNGHLLVCRAYRRRLGRLAGKLAKTKRARPKLCSLVIGLNPTGQAMALAGPTHLEK